MKLINLIFFILFFLYTSFVNSKDINFSGLKKLSVQDLSALVSIDLYKKDYDLFITSSEKLGSLQLELDTKEQRWLELMELT